MSMNTEQPMEDRLWDYIDGHCSPAERSAIEELLATNREWQGKHRELLNLQQLLSSSELEAPSMRFTKNVMEEIARYHVAPATKSYVNKNVIRGIGAFFVTMIVGVLAYFAAQFKWTSTPASGDGGNINLSVQKLGQNLNRLETVNVTKAFNSTYIILLLLIAVILGFALLDMYLQQKKKGLTNP
ncbi:MAG TPA: zf-HC2 domain-containing protein [Puia sp.]